MVSIAQISCGTEWSGVQKMLEEAAHRVGAELFFPEIDLESIKKSNEELALDIASPNLKLMIARTKSIVDGTPADAILLVTCFRCAEGVLTKHALRKYLQRNTDLPLVMYSFTEKPKFGELVTRLEALVTIVERRALLAREKQEGLTIGIDSGSSMTKVVVMEDNEIIGEDWATTIDVVE